MSDADSLNSGDSELNVTAPKILEAVKSYLLDKSFDDKTKPPVGESNPRPSGYIRRISERNVPILSDVVTPAIESAVEIGEQHVGILRENNHELVYIREILCKSIPDALNETLLTAIEERSRRERLEAELEAVHERWKKDVSDLRTIIESKSHTINHLIRLNSAVSREDSDYQLQEALSEIEQLRTLIQTLR